MNSEGHSSFRKELSEPVSSDQRSFLISSHHHPLTLLQHVIMGLEFREYELGWEGNPCLKDKVRMHYLIGAVEFSSFHQALGGFR